MVISLRISYHFYLEFEGQFKSFVKFELNTLYKKNSPTLLVGGLWYNKDFEFWIEEAGDLIICINYAN